VLGKAAASLVAAALSLVAAAATAAATATAATESGASPLRSLARFKSFAPPLPTGAQPNAEPRDFAGVYNINPIAQVLEPLSGGDTQPGGQAILPFTAAGGSIFWRRIERFNARQQIPEPSVMCEPSWKTRTSSLMQFVQNDSLLVIFMAEHHIARLVHMNSAHPTSLKPSYMGHSVGRWEGNTLVVDTIGFNNRGWLDFAGTPQSTRTHLVERLSKQANGDIRVEMKFSDPTLFRHEFAVVEMYRRVGPDWETIDEQICEENERNFDLETGQ
jgi:hypothetical protein